MHENRSCPCPPTVAEEDMVAEDAVLHTVLFASPELFTEGELVRELVDNPEDFGQRDVVERAMRDLAKVGLLHRWAGVVMPSRAAVRFARLVR